MVNWAPLFFGMVLVGPFAHAASGSGNVRYIRYAILSAILGIFFYLIEFGSGCTGLILYLVILWVFLVLGGLVIFTRFLRKYPLSEKGMHDGSK